MEYEVEDLSRQSIQWRLGYQANVAGRSRGDNPYGTFSAVEEARWDDWDNGWCAGPNAIPPEDN